MESEMLAFWQQNAIFQKSLEQRKGGKEFVFYDGPPFATGLPHYGHLLAGSIKDVIPRYQTMRGNYVERRFGWDCHGLPVENEMEKQLNLSSKKDIEAYGIDNFNEACRSIVLRYTNEWEKIVGRMGRWVDFQNGYRTMDRNFMESIWWVFKQLWDKGLVYEGYKILPYCPRCATPLSNFEANQGYKDVTDPAITIRFKVEGEENTYFLAWTTTPWTLPSNVALCMNAKEDYSEIVSGGVHYVMAKALVPTLFEEYEEISVKKGKEYEYTAYEPLFTYALGSFKEKAYYVTCDDYVTLTDGTGIVHIAPAFGEDDAKVGRKYELPFVQLIDERGCFKAEAGEYQGIFAKDADKFIIH
jgi:isoleucyl-tRNA synthetase